ncbi:hypothetical protein A8F57_20000 [Burkholderia cenocepacia]|nr:VapC toxin family PIN domain ribonuclease [Burkholderia cenocepacia]OOA40122.1 hypothetical protein A8F57_20000 [Burkholderia cenocepacia]
MPEPLRREPNAAVIEWLDAQNVETLYLAAIGLAELRSGVAALPEGAGGIGCSRVSGSVCCRCFAVGSCRSTRRRAGRASLCARTRAAGNAIAVADGYIAATAEANGSIVATRDVAPFQASSSIHAPSGSRSPVLLACRNAKRAVRGGAF